LRDAIQRLLALGTRIRAATVDALARSGSAELAAVARDGAGDTIFALDVDAERILLAACEDWGRSASFLLLAEGLDPAGVQFGRGAPEFRLIVDPIDGTRGLMFDKRSAWCLAAIAPDRGPATSLGDVTHAAQVELPTSRQTRADLLWAVRGGGAGGRREDLARGTAQEFRPRPSTARTLRHGFATVCAYFPGGKPLAAEIEEKLLARVHGPWDPGKAEYYCDQYISSGGQLAELALGRDRFVLDLRPWLHAATGAGSLSSRPYDLCTALIASEAGCIVTAPDGAPLAAPLDLTTPVAFVGYANRALRDLVQPALDAVLAETGVQRPRQPGT
jgi:fructose-1,6-bisphosphatase/inositol monophosphatase family enzyme